MSPTAVGSHWREVESEAQWVDGEYLPGGYDVGTCIYAIHHNEEYFPDSADFVPERWLPGFEQAQGKLAAATQAFNSFSVGPRAYIGRSMALTEIGICLARVIWSMDFRQAGGTSHELEFWADDRIRRRIAGIGMVATESDGLRNCTE